MNDETLRDDELQHYGVIGMKWGVRRAQYKSSSNSRLYKKALKYDTKAAVQQKKAEKIHFEKDLGSSARKVKKAVNYLEKAAKLEKKSVNTDNDFNQARLHAKSERLKYKSSKLQIDVDRIAKTKGYSAKALGRSIKSDTALKKAAKMRSKIANNEYYIARMKKKASEVSAEDLKNKYAFIKELDKL